MRALCHLGGELLPVAEARVDPQDRGFLFGDAVYEVVKVLDGVPLHLGPHLERLRNGLERAEIPLPAAIDSRCRELVGAAELRSGYLYLQVSRGVEPRAHIPAPDLEPTLLILPFELVFDPPAGRRLRAVTAPDWRWRFREIKTTSLMATVMGKLRARHEAADEILFIGPGGELREGGSTNVFARLEDRWQTHPTDGRILEGVSRALVIGLAEESRMPVELAGPALRDLDRWREAFLCGTTTGVQPLVEVDGRRIGDGSAGPWTRRLAEAFGALERREVASERSS